MARGFNGSTQILTATSAPVTAAPLTFTAWFNTSALTGAQQIIGVGRNEASGAQFRLMFRGDLANDPLEFTTRTVAEGNATASINTTVTTGTWHHAAGVTASSASRYVYWNGTASTQNTADHTPASIARMAIGGTYVNVATPSFNGYLAEVGIYNAALTTAEIQMLAAGVSPLMVRPGALVAYWPLFGRGGAASNEEDWTGSTTVAHTASPTVVDHPRIIYPRRRTQIFVPAAGGGAAITTAILGSGVGAMGSGLTRAILPAGLGQMG